ncbi:Glycosyltransferase family 1 protein (plasmid) [Shinella sp. WSC3-e]|nr:Glycosyltransferase family 1 protein [Shinella sp. WSC3-e]
MGDLGRLSLKRSQLAIERLSRFRFFSGSDYTALHQDTEKVNPAAHYVGHGADEHRQAARPIHIARTLGELAAGISPSRIVNEYTPRPLLTIGLYVSSLSNVFMQEIAAALGNLLRNAGYTVAEGDEKSDIETRPERCIYVAPHEFFFLGRGPLWVRDDVLEGACMYCTEQVQTQWFWQALHIVLMARSVVDMSMPIAAAFAEVMPAACIFPEIRKIPLSLEAEVRAHPLLAGQRWWIDGPTPADWIGRPLDLCFFGTVSPYRTRFFARNAERLGRYESFIYLRTANATKPMNAETGEARLVDVAQHVARNTRVLLNIHRDEFSYFEWHRLVYQGMANSCTVVSEPCFANPDFQPGIHYLAEESHRLIDLLEWVLNDADGKEKAAVIAQAAAAAARDLKSDIQRSHILAELLTV